MIHRVWQILTSLQRLITLDTKVQLQHGRYHLKDMTHIFLPIKRNKLITPFFIYISMVFCRPSTFCCIPGQLHILIIFYLVCYKHRTQTDTLYHIRLNVCDLKKVFESRKTCSNPAQHLVDSLLLYCQREINLTSSASKQDETKLDNSNTHNHISILANSPPKFMIFRSPLFHVFHHL